MIYDTWSRRWCKIEMGHPDGAREIRAMVLASIPIPPMPAIGSKRLEDEHGTVENHTSAFCSFNMIAHMLNICAKHRNESADIQRKQLQKLADDKLFAQIDAFDNLPLDITDIWPIFCEYKRSVLDLTKY